VGPATLRALNVTAQRRADQIAANLTRERARRLSAGDRYLEVNVPAFTLELIDGGRSLLVLRTIVGRPDWPTPLFSSMVTKLVFGPRWVIPRSIAVSEILPLARRDPRYFGRTRTRVFEPAVRGGIEVDPATIDWNAIPARGFSYQFVQEPGPENPLGGVKLTFQSPYGVFLHDTPARGLFSRTRRTLSHGCVRVEHIERLVEYLLPDWPLDSVRRAMREGRNASVAVPFPIPLHVVYRTAWVESDGLVAFRDDVYRLDGVE
jgi:murein L,D-transpeptidase YcbB/YkuD